MKQDNESAYKISGSMIRKTQTIEKIKPIYTEYLAHMSRFFNIGDVEAWSRAAVKNLNRYVGADDHHIYVLERSGAVIGFALVNDHLRFNADGLAIAEFYVQKEYAKKGYGRRLAEHVFVQFPGRWEVAVTLKNDSALVFWDQVVSTYTKNNFQKKWNHSFNGYGFVFHTG